MTCTGLCGRAFPLVHTDYSSWGRCTAQQHKAVQLTSLPTGSKPGDDGISPGFSTACFIANWSKNRRGKCLRLLLACLLVLLLLGFCSLVYVPESAVFREGGAGKSLVDL